MAEHQQEKLIQNIIGQIKESQIKLGYVRETVRLYYPVSSLNALMGGRAKDPEEMMKELGEDSSLEKSGLGKLHFDIHKGRIEISVPPEGVEYVHREIEDPAFLVDMIQLFRQHHHCSLSDICHIFETYSSDYVCEKMPEGTDFDYVLYFKDLSIDEYCYCIKEEMDHMIYHRFTKEDLQLMYS